MASLKLQKHRLLELLGIEDRMVYNGDLNGGDLKPSNNFVSSLLTDLYQITMCYGYWKNKRHDKFAVFDLFFRKNPFSGEFTIFAGLQEAIGLVNSFHFTPTDIQYLRQQLPNCEEEFFRWLENVNCKDVKVYSVKEGSVIFPRVPVLRVEGPIAICQLLETGLLNLMNYASLIATNAARYRIAAGKEKTLIEFGLRRAQGPDGAMSASVYSYMAGFDGTSNVLAGKMFGIPIKGTHAHSFVQAHSTLDEVKGIQIDGQDFLSVVLKYRQKIGAIHSNDGELAAFIAYAASFPNGFLALLDTYDVLSSGLPNFLAVALALHELGFKPVGIRLDSGDLAYLSLEARRCFKETSETFGIPYFKNLNITASNDINEKVIKALNDEGHAIDTLGVGTNLVTCQEQPALGMVFKLVEIDGQPRIKISQDSAKVTIPGRKDAYRLFGSNGLPILDLLVRSTETPPQPGIRLLCRHPFDEIKRVFVTPSQVVRLNEIVWDGEKGVVGKLPSLIERKEYLSSQVASIRHDVLRPLNPTPYKISVSEELYDFIHNLWMQEIPVQELH